MYNFNKKQKIILGVLVTVVAGFICYYVYSKQNTNVETDMQTDLENTVETR